MTGRDLTEDSKSWIQENSDRISCNTENDDDDDDDEAIAKDIFRMQALKVFAKSRKEVQSVDVKWNKKNFWVQKMWQVDRTEEFGA